MLAFSVQYLNTVFTVECIKYGFTFSKQEFKKTLFVTLLFHQKRVIAVRFDLDAIVFLVELALAERDSKNAGVSF